MPASRGKEPAMPHAHVIPSDDRWNVKQENGDVVSTHDTQAEAEQAAKDWARSHGGGEVFTHRDEGEFSRIRKGDAVWTTSRANARPAAQSRAH
jgi:hypothetical protein